MAKRKGKGTKKNPIDFSSDESASENERDYKRSRIIPKNQGKGQANSKGRSHQKDKGKVKGGHTPYERANQPKKATRSSPSTVGQKRGREEVDDQQYSDSEEEFISLATTATISRQQRRHEERMEAKKQQRQELQDYVFVNYPWMDSLLARNKSASLLEEGQELHASDWFREEVQSLVQYLEPKSHEISLREYSVHRIRTVIQRRWPRAEVYVFGSYSTNLYLPNSDIDLVVEDTGTRIKQWALASALERNGICSTPQVISRAKVPVIKIVDSMTKIKVDIVIDSMSGLDSARKIMTMVKKQPAVRPLSLIVKHYLALRQLNEVYMGGLGGYAIICLVYSFLQMHPLIRSGAIKPMENLGALLIEFFELYGFKFNYDEVAIDVRGSGSYFEKDAVENKPYFAITDPNDSTNDLGIKSYKTDEVIYAFRTAFTCLTRKIFLIEQELEKNDYKSLDDETLSNPKEASVLSSIMYIPNEFLKHRDLLQAVYEEKRWHGQQAALTFNF